LVKEWDYAIEKGMGAMRSLTGFTCMACGIF
jgi:hypothetical protein